VHFSTLFEGFHARTRATAELFADPSTAFLIITSPDPMTVREALYFRRHLGTLRVRLGALIVNRVRRTFDGADTDDIPAVVDALMAIEGAAIEGRATLERLARKLVHNAHEWDVLALRDRQVCADLAAEVAPSAVLAIPLHAGDVHNLELLEQLRQDLLAATPARR
ncbi:MAG: hypothetical protein KGO50_13220, partial [Myxococcales bacterium]|nr:hypothetical protein [Myxococcales bacterium]